jgi:microcystin-dependent protein
MADAYTPSLALIQPEVGASRDTWGTKWNQNATIIDQFVSRFCVVGMIADFAGPTPPSGWLIADGRTVSRTTYSKLFAVIGTYWGAGDGSTTFGLPNMNGRAGIGPGAMTDALGYTYNFTFTQKHGVSYQIIQQTHLPAYNLVTDAQGYHSHGGSTQASGAHAHTTDAQGTHSHGGGTSNNNVDHTHAGVTDAQGDHSHSITAPAGSGVAAGGISAIAGGSAGGYTTSVNGIHQHNVSVGGASTAHSHTIFGDGSHAHTTNTAADHAHGIWGDGSHQHNVNLGGGGQSLYVQSPALVITKIIYAGAEAAIVTAADIAAAPTSPDTHQEIENLREEIAALRSLFETPRARMLSAPSRGPH